MVEGKVPPWSRPWRRVGRAACGVTGGPTEAGAKRPAPRRARARAEGGGEREESGPVAGMGWTDEDVELRVPIMMENRESGGCRVGCRGWGGGGGRGGKRERESRLRSGCSVQCLLDARKLRIRIDGCRTDECGQTSWNRVNASGGRARKSFEFDRLLHPAFIGYHGRREHEKSYEREIVITTYRYSV